MSAYRSSAKPTEKPDLSCLQFAVELEEARIASIYEHLRIAVAGLVAFLNVVSWFAGVELLPLADLFGPIGRFAAFLVWMLGFYVMAIYSFHITHRLLGGRAHWPRLRTVLGVALEYR